MDSMVGSDWAKVLNHLYEIGGVHHETINEARNQLQLKEAFRQRVQGELGLTSTTDKELRILFDSLENLRQIEFVVNSDWAEIRLTESGFKVAHDRVKTNRQHWTNKIILILTVGLFFAAIVQAVAAFQNVPATGQPSILWVFLLSGVGSIAIVLAITFWM